MEQTTVLVKSLLLEKNKIFLKTINQNIFQLIKLELYLSELSFQKVRVPQSTIMLFRNLVVSFL